MFFRALFLLSLLHLLLAPTARAEDVPTRAPVTAQILTAKSGVRFGIWPAKPAKPAPTIFVLANSIEGTLNDVYFRQSGTVLAQRGYLCVSVDLPCHGQEKQAGETNEKNELTLWRQRCEKNTDVMLDLTTRLRAVLDYLIAEGFTDPAQVAACGTSRGGFSAMHFAATEPRVKCVAAFGPLVDPAVLREFQGAEHVPLVKQLSLENHADKLAGRALWIVIGDRDERVGTDEVIRFARKVTAESLKQKLPALVDLHVISQPKGHSIPPGSGDLAAEWIDQQIRPRK